MMINVNGSSFRLEAVPQHVIDAYGDCELSDGTGPGVIRVSEDIIGEALLDTLIHEYTHADMDFLSEPFVERHGKGLARLLIQLGVIDMSKLTARALRLK